MRTPCAWCARWLCSRAMSARIPDLTERLQFRLTPAEKRALEVLAQKRAAAMEAADGLGDPSLGGWLRVQIRKEAKAAGIEIATAPSVEKGRTPAKAPRARGKRS